jgi:hypothetical protein
MCELNKKIIKTRICKLCLSKECDESMVWCRECYKNEARKRYKKYYESNKEIEIERQRIYYELNKENIDSKNRERVTCECGCILNKGNLSSHKKTKTHNKYLLNKQTL